MTDSPRNKLNVEIETCAISCTIYLQKYLGLAELHSSTKREDRDVFEAI